MRFQGCRDLQVYCNSSDCDYRTIINFGHLPDELAIRRVGNAIPCRRCGHVGARVTPN
jgi:hypothetical protein